MSATRQPLLTLSPSQHVYVGSPKAGRTEHCHHQTTPTLPRRERRASISRLLKNKNFAQFSEKSANDHQDRKSSKCSPRRALQPSVDIRIFPCSPPEMQDTHLEDKALMTATKGLMSPNSLPFSPRLLRRKSPVSFSPDYKRPSPVRSPLYTADSERIFLGRGSFGKVTLCKYSDSYFAVKVVNHPVHSVGEKNLLGIRHSHLVEIFHISTVLDRTLIFMEFAGHCNLQQVLNTKSELDFKRRVSFCIQIISGLRHCHQKRIVHGDVKPANVMISPMGICKLGDFGNSMKVDEHHEYNPSKDAVGTAVYAAPEVLRGSCPSPSSDVYSFGILLWQVQTREIPFAGEHPHVVIYKVVNYGHRPKFPDVGDPALLQYEQTAEECWRADPAERIVAGEVLLALQDVMQQIKEANGN